MTYQHPIGDLLLCVSMYIHSPESGLLHRAPHPVSAAIPAAVEEIRVVDHAGASRGMNRDRPGVARELLLGVHRRGIF